MYGCECVWLVLSMFVCVHAHFVKERQKNERCTIEQSDSLAQPGPTGVCPPETDMMRCAEAFRASAG